MNKVIHKRSVDTIFVLIIFSIFAVSVLMVLMLGASVYRNVNDISREDQYEHTALSYIWTKTKNFDENGGITVGDFNGVPALIINETIGETNFRTVIYHHDGWLRELFSEATLDFSLYDGKQLVTIDDLSFEMLDNGLIKAETGNMSLLLSPRSGLDIQITN